MLAELGTSAASRLAERWASLTLSPAFAFWAGALVAWLWGHDGGAVGQDGWAAALARWSASIAMFTSSVQLALVVGTLLGVTTSAAIVGMCSASVLRLLEGYWPSWLSGPREALIERQSGRIDRERGRLRELALRDVSSLTRREVQEYAWLDERRRRIPGRPQLRMPTRLGNVLRAAESRPGSRYGLQAVVCWPRLWLLLPDATKREVARARQRLDAAAQWCLWGVLFTIWSVLAWWALPLGVAIAVAVYYFRMLDVARTYADLVESCFDVHRRLLYDALRWPLPGTPADEPHLGRALTQYLWRGSVAPAPTFKTASAPPDGQETVAHDDDAVSRAAGS